MAWLFHWRGNFYFLSPKLLTSEQCWHSNFTFFSGMAWKNRTFRRILHQFDGWDKLVLRNADSVLCDHCIVLCIFLPSPCKEVRFVYFFICTVTCIYLVFSLVWFFTISLHVQLYTCMGHIKRYVQCTIGLYSRKPFVSTINLQ